MGFLVHAALLAAFSDPAPAVSPGKYVPVKSTEESPPAYDRYTTQDKYKRNITFYVAKGDKKLPLALVILGSGGQSIWIRVGDKIAGGIQNLLLSVGKDKLRVVVVEKPGVAFGFQPPRPGSAEGCSYEFLGEHTLERWAEANKAALLSCMKLPNVDKSRILVTGHSEGGIVSARVAAEVKQVTHTGVLAGGGPSQLEDLKTMMPDLEEQWKAICAEPKSTTKFAWGHPYLRWSTFLASSTTKELLRRKTKVFMAAGTADTSVPIAAFDSCCQELEKHKRPFTKLRVEGADHGFGKPEDQGKPDGFRKVIEEMVTWFLAD